MNVGSRNSIVAALSGAVAGCSAWLTAGVLTVEGAGSAARLGVLPHPAWLLASMAAGGACVLLLERFSGLKRVRGWYYPLYSTAIVALPWLPIPVPAAALVWAGPSAWFVWGGAAVSIAVAVAPAAKGRPMARARRFLSGPRAAWAAGALGALVYGATAVHLSPIFPGGDEPHYLVIAQSLIEDGDIRIENNYRERDYLPYFQADLAPHSLRRGRNGEMYSVHAPGLPAVLVPAFAVGGYPAVVAFLVGVAALVSLLTWRAAFLAAGNASAAWFGWAAAALSTPVLLHSFAVYPETTGALLVMAAAVTLIGLDRLRAPREEAASKCSAPVVVDPATWHWSLWLCLGAALALLPWLHTRYAMLSLVFGLVLGVRLAERRGSSRRVLAFYAVPALSAALWFRFFKSIYGTYSPAGPYGHYTQTDMAHVPSGLGGLLFDQQFGLLPNAPAFVLALAGFAALSRRRPRLSAEILVSSVAYAVTVATYAMWWGGWSAPARFLVPVLPLLAVPAAMWWAEREVRARGDGKAGARLAGGVLLALSLMLTATVTLAERGSLVFNSRDGVARLFEYLSPVADLNRALPSFFRGNLRGSFLDAVLWTVVAALAAAVLSWTAARFRLRPWAGRPVASILVAATALMVGMETTWRLHPGRRIDPAASQTAFLEAAKSPRSIGIRYSPLSVMPPRSLAGQVHLGTPGRRGRGANDRAWSLSPVPAGTYRIDVSKAGQIRGPMSVWIGRAGSPIATWNEPKAAGDWTLSLPCAVNAVVIDGMADYRDALSRLTLRPVGLPAVRDCPPVRASRAVRYASAVVFFFDDKSYAEDAGFWVRGKAVSVVAIDPDLPAAAARLRLRAGASALSVRLDSGAWNATVDLHGWEERDIAIPVDRQGGAAIVRVAPDNGFVPALTDLGSRDRRFLGCWISFP